MADDKRLEDLWESAPNLGTIARTLGRSQYSCWFRARRRLGLPEVPPGFEYLTHAAKRTGYDVKQLRPILEAAHVAIRPSLANPRDRRGPAHFFIVESFAVDCAVERRQELEPVHTITRRLGLVVCSRTVQRHLELRNPPGRRRHLLVSEAQVREAFAQESEREPRALAGRSR